VGRESGRTFRIILILAVAVLSAAGLRPAVAAQYGAIVMDMRDGTVLHESNADHVQAPASLTKMMTLYLTFEAVRNGQISLDQSVRVSRHAASQPPSKLYLKAGQRVTIRSLIRAAAVKSANDAAVALAEAIGGSEQAFARLMTAKARELGMSRTTFKNANGLTASGHVSTPRDMATLGRYLFFDFPQYYNIFSRKSDRAAGKRIFTTNRLLSSYPGADGIKTGYTNAAGYTLVASAHRGDKRIVAAIFGGKSSRSRNARMATLLDQGFARAAARVAMVPPRAQRILVAEAPLPAPRPGAPATGFAALVEVLASEAQAATISESLYAPLRVMTPPARPGSDDSTTAAGVPLPVARPAWSVQLGTFENHEIAIARLNEVMLGDLGTLAAAAPVIEEIRGREGAALYRVRLAGLSRVDATAACRTLKAGGRACQTVSSGG
jgi:D-alanyl-D-alanine carboxypeptidase